MSQKLFGIHPILELLASNPKRFRKIQMKSGKLGGGLAKVEAQAEKLSIPIERTDNNRLTQIADGGNHQGVVAEVEEFVYYDLEDWIRSLPDGRKPDVAVLDSIQDPHNLGALLRSADCFGVGAVIISKDGSVQVTPVVERVAAGAAEFVPICRVTNLSRAIDRLKKAGYWIAGLDPEGEQSMYSLDLTDGTAFVFGSEGKGLRRLTKERCDWLATLPREGKIQSLNLSVSAGIVFSESYRQKKLSLA